MELLKLLVLGLLAPVVLFGQDTNAVVADINECEEDPNPCGLHTCVNTQGSYNCTCLPGYSKNAEGVCADIDDCAAGACGIHTCLNLEGTYLCTCLSGYYLDSVTGQCVDNDECSIGDTNGGCNENTTDCYNTAGAHKCECKAGFQRLPDGSDSSCVDKDECVSGDHTCNSTTEVCVNTLGEHVCECASGYQKNAENKCVVVLESDNDNDNAVEESLCAEDCTATQYCGTVPDYEKIQAAINETVPDYTCIETGWQPGACSMAYANCDPVANCTDGEKGTYSYKCTCPDDAVGDGYVNGTQCELLYTVCSDNFNCVNYAHCNEKFTCQCNDGYEGDARYNCTDIVDCPADCSSHAECKDTPGSYMCTCDVANGFYGDGKTCTYRCYADDDCHWNGFCVGATQECDCRAGYQGNGTKIAGGCEDVLECEDPALNNCHENAKCIEEAGSYSCECSNGYEGDGVECKKLQKSCQAILDNDKRLSFGAIYTIDPDFTGPANPFEVRCQRSRDNVILTELRSKNYPITVTDPNTDVEYEAEDDDIKAFTNSSGFCKQEVQFQCGSTFALFPGTTWFDIHGKAHQSWGSFNDQECACGAVGECVSKCMCDGTRATTEKANFFNKDELPVRKFQFDQPSLDGASIRYVGPLTCADTQFAIPKDCHEAKYQLGIRNNGPLFIDADGDGPAAPFLALCDMTTFDHVGLTIINPITDTITDPRESKTVDYNNDEHQIKALIDGSLFCSQRIEFQCKDSPLLGQDGGYVSGPTQRLDYFPGALGEQGMCGCGATKSCDKPDVTCNCNIQDGVDRKDFGLIVDKNDLPAVSVSAAIGDQRSSAYKIGGLQCSQKQFGIEPNCQKYLIGQQINEDYTYLVDADGPGGLEPFLVECEFTESPPMGKTIFHHNWEGNRTVVDPNYFLKYLNVTPEQIETFKDRSPATVCNQEVTVGCNRYNLKFDDKAVTWRSADGLDLELAFNLDSCNLDGTNCACTSTSVSNDKGVLIEQPQLPLQSLDFTSTSAQFRSEIDINVGPLVCAELFPTCAELKKFIDSPASAEGEKIVYHGKFTIDPDGLGGVDPFEVLCQFPATIIEITPGDGDIVSPDPNNTGNSSEPASICYPVSYSDGMGNPITPEQITALVQASGNCKQPLEVECQNTPVTNMINYTSCDGVTQPGWAGSFGEEKCACGVNGNCAGGIDANCNCDMADDEQRSDKGTIVETDRLPVCEVCLSTPAEQLDPNQPPPPPRRLKYILGKLECDGPTGTGGNTCQEARKKTNTADIVGESIEVGVTLMEEFPAAFGCRFYNNPPVGELLVKPKIPVYPPGNDTDPVDIEIIYINVDINITKPAMDKNEYCSQVVYLFCANDYDLTMGGNNVWMDFDNNEFTEWEELKAGHEDVNAMCEHYEELCSRCGSPRGFRVGVKQRLPIKRIKLDVTGVTVVVGEVACVDLLMSCQDVVDQHDKRYSGYMRGNLWVIDPDAAGDTKPFQVPCHMDWRNKNGITEMRVEPKGFWSGNPPFKYTSNIEEPASFSLPIEYKEATHDQVEALTKISGFCWQNVKYECIQAPIMKDGQTSTLIQGMNGVNATGFGTDFQGCACSQTGTCEEEGLVCNCDAMTTAVDQGSITDKDLLPITNILVGGQSPLGSAKTTVGSVRCSNKAVEPPRDCAAALKMRYRYGNDYTKSGEMLISPDPENPSIKPFMVRCDFDLIPGQGVTIINPHYPENSNTSDPKHKNKLNITTTPGSSTGTEEVTEISYYTPEVDQIKALITYSEYCYQGVRIECQNAALFSEGSHWFAAGDETKTPITFWGGGNAASNGRGFCACGASSNCGGLDSSEAQRERHCNCDANDGEMRADAGILTDKAFMPVGNFVTGSTVSIGSLNMTVGPIFCSDKPIPMNECEMGFHDCHKQATCRDTEENYRCECNAGWRGKGAILGQAAPRANGRECIDDDECSWNPCHFDQHCNNYPGTYNCTCKSGLDQTGPMECEDINECLNETLNECHEHAECKNTHRSYECRCKSGFRGDGRTECIPVGQCFSFGDPHLISFDQKWLHFMGTCEYTMAQDGCNGTDPTWKVNVAHWKENNVRPGYYAWIKEVTIELPVVGFTIKLFQGHGIEVNGVAMTQFHDAHRVSVVRVLDQVKVKVITGLEVNWDGRDVLEIYVPIGDTGKTCGMCGNFNQDPTDDWTIGPSCPAKEGQRTENYDLFGRSWTVTDSAAQCTPDCSNEKPNPNITTCVLPMKMVEQECDKLLVVPKSPFTECLKMKSPEVLKELRYSCMFDGCNEEFNIRDRMCLIAKAIFQHCATFDNVRIDAWRQKVEACDTPTCDHGMVYNSCGSANPETCLSASVDLDTLDAGDVCADGCFCPEGTLQEGDKCVKPEDCGCFYKNEYLAAGEEVVMPNCGDTLKCLGKNNTQVTPMNCTENQECGVSEITGKRACVCIEGLKWNPVTKSCVVDKCSNVTCELINAECDPELNGTCKCAEGYMADCNVCDDIDECAIGTYDCNTKMGFECVNTLGSYVCVCGSGTITKGEECEDIDECKYDGLQDCGPNSQCVNLYGGSTCECCAGYTKNDDDECVVDGSSRASGGRCCNCVGHLCSREGKVCGTDANTYASFRDMEVNKCRQNTDIKVSYNGECQSTCETTNCEKKFSNCTMDENNKPQCACPTCENVTNTFEEDLVCATNKITYISICHLKKDLCASHIDTQVEIEIIGKPCPEGNGTEKPKEGDWEEWGPCSEDCRQGTTTRNRTNNGNTGLHEEETKSCYATCPDGPCTATTCEQPGSVCTVTVDNATDCSCPNCTEPYDPVCGQVGNYVSTFDNLCSLDKAACDQGKDFEVLEMNACEDKPKGCGRVRRFKTFEDSDGYMADREIDLGYCYGGCAEGNENNNMCCQGTKFEYKFAILTRLDTVTGETHRRNKFIKQIKDCDCIDNAQPDEPVMQQVQPEMAQIVNL